MATALSDDVSAEERIEMSLNYRNLLDSEDSRWIRPRDENGNWVTPFYPEIGYGFQEGTSWQYSWLTMHDYDGLIAGMGGADQVNSRLDTFFGFPAAAAPYAWPSIQNQATAFGLVYYGNQYAPGNEHDLEAPYVYNYTGQPWRTQAVARSAASIFTGTAAGLPGNDDLGALSGWLVWAMLGMYPINPGLPVYTYSSPVFDYARINRDDGDIVITAANASVSNRFIQKLSVNGVESAENWLVMPREPVSISIKLSAAPDLDSPLTAPPSISSSGIDVFGCKL
jgi:predicted alpha-1,2-mannosidase